MLILTMIVNLFEVGQYFLLVDLQEIFFRFRVGGRKKKNNKALKMTSSVDSEVFARNLFAQIALKDI